LHLFVPGMVRSQPGAKLAGAPTAANACAIDRIDGGAPGAILVVAAHPDDETVGIGATLGALVSSGWRVRVLHVTDGAPRDPALRPTLREATIAGAASVRCAEVRAALRAGGLDPELALERSIDIPDQSAARVLAPLARTLAERLDASPVDVVVTHPYEGGHPDHDAVAFAVHAAAALLGDRAPSLVEMTSYHRANGAIALATFLPLASAPRAHLRSGVLDEAARVRRRAMLDAFTSQREVLRVFESVAEPLRCAPCYDFTRPPHEGVLYYELLPFGWTGEQWRELARDALCELGVDAATLMRRRGCSSAPGRG